MYDSSRQVVERDSTTLRSLPVLVLALVALVLALATTRPGVAGAPVVTCQYGTESVPCAVLDSVYAAEVAQQGRP